MQRTTRMQREVLMLRTDLPSDIVCFPRDEETNLFELEAWISGSIGTPYEGGRFKVQINIPERYPFEPPTFRFTTKIYHPNIDHAGRICLSAIQPPPNGTWKPSLNICTALKSLQLLINNPNPSDPLMVDIAEQFQFNRTAFDNEARRWTNLYAKTKCD